MTTAAIYCRISDDREGSALGVERQEKDCRALAERHGWEVAKVYVDNDVSAYDRKRKRKQWAELLAALGRSEYQAVIAWHPDRLYRQMRDLLALIELCDRDRVKVATVTAGDVDLSTATGRALAKTVAAWNEHESEHKAERNRAKALELAEAGKVGNGGPRPFGYARDRITVCPDEAAVLVQAYSDVLAGRSLRGICADLHQQGVKATTGGPWTVQALRLALLRGRNIGWREHHGKLLAPAVWPAIIDRDTWEQTRAVLTDPARGTRDSARRYLLTGYLHCALCGGRLRPVRNAHAQRFGCRREPGQPSCGGVLIVYEPTVRHVENLLLARLERDADLTPQDHDDPTDDLRQQIAQEEAKLKALAVAYADTGDFLEMRLAGEAIREKIGGLRRQVAQADRTSRVAEPMEVRRLWPTLSLDERRAVLDQLVERVDVGPARRGLNRFDPDRLTVIWR